MKNDFSNIPAESELRDEMTAASNEPSLHNPAYDGPMGIFEGMDDDKEPDWNEKMGHIIDMVNADLREEIADRLCEPAPDSHLESDYEDRQNGGVEDDVETGWPGDGSGTDDFEDFNQMEADDYRDE